MTLLSAATKLVAYAQQLQADNLQLAQEKAAALADDEADTATIAAAEAKVAELQAIVDSGIGIDGADETALAASIESMIAPLVDPMAPVETPVA